MATRPRPANDIADLRAREVGTRLVLSPLTIVQIAHREIKYRGIEQTVYDYHFAMDDKGLWRVEYSGRYYHSWQMGKTIALVATIHRHSERWRCTRIKRPVVCAPSDVPLFGKDW